MCNIVQRFAKIDSRVDVAMNQFLKQKQALSTRPAKRNFRKSFKSMYTSQILRAVSSASIFLDRSTRSPQICLAAR